MRTTVILALVAFSGQERGAYVPEGDTVWLTAQRLNHALGGQVVQRSDFRVPRYATTDLSGWCVQQVLSRGKHLLMRLTAPAASGNDSPPLSIHSHLRMDGSWHLYPLTDPRAARLSRGWQVRLALWTSSTVALGLRLPIIDVAPTSQESQWVGHLGPDLLGPDWDEQLALNRLLADPHRAIGPALLDQRNLAGIGNLYKCEVLFLSGLHPGRAVAEIELCRLRDTLALAQQLLHRNREIPEQVTTGNRSRGQHHWVYERAGLPCRRCASPIQRAEQPEPHHPGQERITYWCPQCQR